MVWGQGCEKSEGPRGTPRRHPALHSPGPRPSWATILTFVLLYAVIFFFGRPPCNALINLKLIANERSSKVTIKLCHRPGDPKNIWRQKTPKTDFLRGPSKISLRGLCGVWPRKPRPRKRPRKIQRAAVLFQNWNQVQRHILSLYVYRL